MRARLLLNQRAYFLDKLIFVSVELYSKKAKPGIYIPRILYSIVNKSYIFYTALFTAKGRLPVRLPRIRDGNIMDMTKSEGLTNVIAIWFKTYSLTNRVTIAFSLIVFFKIESRFFKSQKSKVLTKKDSKRNSFIYSIFY